MLLPETTIGLGVRDPVGRAESVVSKFSVLLETLHHLNAKLAIVGYDSNTEGAPFQQLRLAADETDMTFSVSDSETSVDVIRDFTGTFPSQNVPMLNEPEVRAATGNKAKVAEILGEDTLPTQVLPANTDLRGFLLNMDGDAFIVKPISGLQSKGVEVVSSPIDAAKSYADSMIVQPYVDTSRIPTGVHGVGEYYEYLANQEELPKEIRMYTYRTDDSSLKQVPILRVSKYPEMLMDDYFVIIDPDTVPQEAYDVSKRAADAVAHYTGVPYLHGAIDMFWSDGTFKVMDFNTKEPAMPGVKKGYFNEDPLSASARMATGYYTRQLLAQQLISLSSKA